MSEADTDPTTEATDTDGQASVIDKAKQAASDIDVDALKGRAKEVAGDVKDRSATAAATAKDKVREVVGTNEEKIGGAIDRAGQFFDETLTRQKFSDQIGKVSDVAKGAVNKVGQADDADDDITDAEIVDEGDGADPSKGPADEA